MLTEPVIEIATKDPVTITPDTPISKAIGIMEKHHFHNLIVLDEREEIYLVTIHDLLLASSVNETIETLMFKPHCVNENTPVIDAICEILDSGQRAAPVVDDNGKLVGIVTDYDIMSRVGRSQLLKDVKVTRVMTRDPITIYEYESIGKARSLMRKHNIGRLIVLDRDGKPIGMVTEDDILRKIYKPKRRMTLGEVVGEKVPRMSQPVSLIMSTPLITADMDATIPEVARIMEKYDIRGVPIMKRGRLKGIVTRIDIMKYIKELREGSYVEVEIYGEFDEEMKELAERILATEVKKIVKYTGKPQWIKISIKKEHDKGGVPYYHVKVYVKTPGKLYVGEGRPKLSISKRMEMEEEDVVLVTEKQRWDFIEVLKDALDAVLKRIEMDKEREHPRHVKRELEK
ncbi:MAG TPA: CBS domain-containing protein [Methanothermococcus okinawensis]|uniref:CBS domain-containing protein n=1 Tax=Methanothermococcus okinawensis TaxID=155863 RepID=A0A832ZYV4_9EURY|nr:CBS domain-containing protein [Methanothermococcus okinawensis]